MKRAVGYIRRSTDKQDQSLEDQKRAIEKFAKENNFVLIRFYEDDGISGVFTYNRSSFKEMIELATNGHKDFDTILVWDIKRFSRGDNDEAGHYRYLLRQNGIEVVYISENLRGDDSDDLVLGTKQWLAREESKDKSRDVIRGQLSRIFKGLSSSGHPYGYYRQIIDKNNNVIQVCKRCEKSRAANEDYTKLIPGDPEEVKVVRMIFDCYVNKGMGYRLIARMLNQEGLPSPRRKKWNLSAIEFILSNQIYIGNLVYNKTSKSKFHCIVKTDRGFEAKYKGKITKPKIERIRDKEQWIIIKNAVEPIISQELFYKAQKVKHQRLSNKCFSGKATTSNYLWTGIIRCKYCGRTMNGCYVKSKYGRNSYYVCSGCTELGERKKSIISATQLDNSLLNRIRERFFNSQRLQNTLLAIKKRLIGQADNSKLDLVEIEKRLKDNEEKINNLLDLIDLRHKDLINIKLDELTEEKERLSLERQRLSSKRLDFNVEKVAADILGCAKDFEKVLQQGSPSERKEIVRSYIGQILVDTDIKLAKVGFYPLPNIPLLDPLIYGYAMNLEQ